MRAKYENAIGWAVARLYWEGLHVPREYIPEQVLRYPKVRLASFGR